MSSCQSFAVTSTEIQRTVRRITQSASCINGVLFCNVFSLVQVAKVFFGLQAVDSGNAGRAMQPQHWCLTIVQFPDFSGSSISSECADHLEYATWLLTHTSLLFCSLFSLDWMWITSSKDFDGRTDLGLSGDLREQLQQVPNHLEKG